MKKDLIIIKAVFWALVGVCVLIVSIFLIPVVGEIFRGPQFLWPIVIFFLLGLALLILAAKAKMERRLKKFLMLAGGSAAGFLVSIFLHNLIYGLFIQLFGVGFWERIGLGDEPLFFFLGLLVCPIGFLIGVVGSGYLLFKGKS